MTAEMTPGGPAEPRPALRPSLSQRMVRDGVWLAVMTRILGDRRFQATVITGALGTYALLSLLKNNQARPLRRTASWYSRRASPRTEPGKR